MEANSMIQTYMNADQEEKVNIFLEHRYLRDVFTAKEYEKSMGKENSKKIVLSLKDKIIKYLSLIIGGGSLVLFFVFLLIGPFKTFDFQLGHKTALCIDIFLSILFCFQHSLMARQGAKNLISKIFHKKYYEASFSIVSGVTLILLVLFWQETFLIFKAGLFLSWILFGVFFLSAIGMYWGAFSLKKIDPFGAWALLDKERIQNPPLMIRGPYRFVRHPLYFFSLVMIWANSDLTTGRLLLDIILTIWIIVGCGFEEKDLVKIFGSKYVEYQLKVPMIFPYKRPVKEQSI